VSGRAVERRIVTILFADLVGSKAIRALEAAGGAPPELVREADEIDRRLSIA
jgi:hypothetical protein